MRSAPVLQGERVRLEPLRAGHLPGLLEAARHGRDSFGLTDVPDEEAAMARYVRSALADPRDQLPFATLAPDGTVLGSTRFLNLEYWRWREDRRPRPADEPDAAEIGATWLTGPAQRTGVNREAKLLMLTLAFEQWQLSRVNLRTDARNTRSRAAIERLGARLDGILRADKPAHDGGIRDSAAYSILAPEWPRVRARLEASLRRAPAPG